jgi:uncharacterized membrane protein YhfC
LDALWIAHFLNALLMIAMPIGLAVWLTTRWKLPWRLWLVGGATFILSQVGHIPFNLAMTEALKGTPLATLPPEAQRLFSAVFLGLSAGLFEELSRYAMYRWWLKDARSWRKGVLAGAGHGGAEAILLGLLTFLAFLELAALRGVDLSRLVPVEQLALAQQQVAAYWSMPWTDALLGALERLFAIPVQIALSVIVLQAFTRKQWGWVVLAIAYHALVDAAALLALPSLGAHGTEALVGGFAVLSLAITYLLRQPEPALAPAPEAAAPAAAFTLKPVEETPDRLDETRYQ